MSNTKADHNGHLSPGEKERYSRHLMLPEIGEAGQLRLKQASVLLVGAGGLGSPAALYLAAAGVGRIGLVDDDAVDESNLQRQILFGTSQAGESKVEAARERLVDLNPYCNVESWSERLSPGNASEIASTYDIIVDGADNFSTRYLTNDLAVFQGKPLVHGSIYKFEGQVSVFDREGGPCYRCIYPDPPPEGSVPSCGEIGVLGVLPGMVGTLMATETVKLILGLGETLSGRILMYDALKQHFRELRIGRDPECRVCGDNPSIRNFGEYSYEYLCHVDNIEHSEKRKQEESMGKIPTISAKELAEWRESGKEFTLVDVREPAEYQEANIGGDLIPLGQLQQRMSEIPKDGDVVVMCRSGGRSGRAVEALMSVGYSNLLNLEGGIMAWQRAKLPVNA